MHIKLRKFYCVYVFTILFSPSIEDIKHWRQVSDFFFRMQIEVEMDYKESKITKKERDKKLKKISKDWGYSVIKNSPFINANPELKEVANRLAQDWNSS